MIGLGSDKNQICKIERNRVYDWSFNCPSRFYVPYLVWLTFPSQEMKRTLSSKDGFRALSHPNWLVKALICADVGQNTFPTWKDRRHRVWLLGVGAILARSASAPTCHTKISQITKFYSFVTIFANTHVRFPSKTTKMIDGPTNTQ